MTLPNVENTFAGTPMAQTWTDLAIWEEFLNRHPVASVVELGTWKGGMAAFLSFQAKARGFRFVTIDSNAGWMENAKLVASLGGEAVCRDVFDPSIAGLLRHIPTPKLLFCDDGDKRRELREIAPQLEEGDFVAVHDWGSEAGPEDVPTDWTCLMEPECAVAKSLTRFFRIP